MSAANVVPSVAVDDDHDEEEEGVDLLDENEADEDFVEDLDSVPYILKSYFKLVSKIVDGKATGKCTLCPSTSKTFNGTIRVTTNLTTHLVMFRNFPKIVASNNRIFFCLCRS